jgi:sugar/nucleoside kinase (ribokinase family)
VIVFSFGVGPLNVDYMIIGNVTKDLLPDAAFTIGGTVTYSARTALALGQRVGVVTSAAEDFDLDAVLSGIEIARQPSTQTLTFENIYSSAGREQIIHAVGARLGPDDVPPEWHRPKIVHLAPLAGECDAKLFDAFPGAFVGVTPQGWLRVWDDAGRVRVGDWADADSLLPQVDAAVMSTKDVENDESVIAHFARLAPVLVVTLGDQGCRVYAQGHERHIPVTPVPETDPTGAGDIFAAAFFVCLQQNGDPWHAADFANRIAALSVSRPGWAGTPTAEEVKEIECAAPPFGP